MCKCSLHQIAYNLSEQNCSEFNSIPEPIDFDYFKFNKLLNDLIVLVLRFFFRKIASKFKGNNTSKLSELVGFFKPMNCGSRATKNMSITYNNEFDMQFHKVIPNVDVKNFTFNR